MSDPFKTIYGLRKELGLDDETARDLYEREVGKRSLRDMSVGEQVRVVQALQRAKRGNSTAAAGMDGRFAGICRALWICGYELGVFESSADEALMAFVARQTGIHAVTWLRDPKDGSRVIEALKSWLAREAGVQWPKPRFDNAESRKRAVIAAQLRILGEDVPETLPGSLSQLDTVIRTLGRRIREAGR